MNKFITALLIVFSGILLSSLVIYAQTTGDDSRVAPEIVYPVSELGGCENQEACFAYCELAANDSRCLAFAKEHKLLPEEEIRLAEKVLGVEGGPGGCSSKESCENYCDDVAHINECIAFAEEHGLMKGEGLAEAKKIRALIQSGQTMPGGCRNKTACENYCKSLEHIDECLAFAERAGFLPPAELEQARKFMPLMKEGLTPGGCQSKEACEAYCESDLHFDECISFAEKHGLIPEEERKHIEAFKRAGGKGPGGCVGRQCQAFCEQPENQETCFKWARDNGMLREEDLHRMEEGKRQMEKAFEDAPPEVLSCIEVALGPGGLERMRAGEFFGGEVVGQKIKRCFEGFMKDAGDDFNRVEQGGEGFGGPGGCRGPEECMNYCKSHPEACRSFTPEPREVNDAFPPPPSEFPIDLKSFDEGQYQGEFRAPHPYDGEYQEQYRQQYEEQYREQYEKQYPEQPGEFYPPPPEGSYPTPSPETYTEPSARGPIRNLLGFVLAPLLDLLR